MATQVEPQGAGEIVSEDFGEWYNPSPGWPFLHHNRMAYFVEAKPADGYVLSHRQAVGRKSNNPNDVYNETHGPLYNIFRVYLSAQRDIGIKSPLVYLVAHFRKIEPETVEPVLESPPTTFEPNPTPDDREAPCKTCINRDEPEGVCNFCEAPGWDKYESATDTIEETWTISLDETGKDEILRALDDIVANVEKIRNRVEGL